MATVELAVAMPALVLVLVLALSGLSAGVERIRCVDAAREAARVAARGEGSDRARVAAARAAPAGATVQVAASGREVRVTVRARPHPGLARLGVRWSAAATAVAVTEVPWAGEPP